MTDFFSRLDYQRKKRGETLVDVARIVGISGPAIHAWKKGSLPTPDKLHLLASHYGVSVEWLLTGNNSAVEQREASVINDLSSAKARIGDLERQLERANETIASQARTIEAMQQGRATQQRVPPLAPTAHAGGMRRPASTSDERRAGA